MKKLVLHPNKNNYAKIQNKKLVNILNHKIFKGFREIKNSKKNYYKYNEYFLKLYNKWTEIEPFDDDYNIYYKNKFLSNKYNFSTQNLLTIKNISINTNQKNNKIKNLKKSFDKIKNIEQNNKIFLTNDNNNIKENFSITERKNNFIFKEILSDTENNNINKIPLIYIEKKRKNKSFSKKIIKSINEKDIFNGMTENEFLYKISHNKNYKIKYFPLKFNNKNSLIKGNLSPRNNNKILENKNFNINLINKNLKNIKNINYSCKNLQIKYNN